MEIEGNVNPEGTAAPEGNGGQSTEDLSALAEGMGEEIGILGEGAPEGQPAGEDEGQEQQLYTVKVNGEEKQVPLDELVKGYQLDSDYRQKTAKVAEQSRQAQAQVQQAIAAQQHYQRQLEEVHARMLSMQPQPPDPNLINTDPVSYLRQQEAYSAFQRQVQQVEKAHADNARQLAAVQQSNQAATVAREAEAMAAAIPEWADPKVAQEEKGQLVQYLVGKVGYTREEVAQAIDHRAVVIARKAMLFDKVMGSQGRKTLQEKIASVPPKSPQKPGRGGSVAASKQSQRIQALKKSGSVDDAAAIFSAMLG